MKLVHAIAVLEQASEVARHNGTIALHERREDDVQSYVERLASYDQAISILKAKE